jgi:hypothetical protein
VFKVIFMECSLSTLTNVEESIGKLLTALWQETEKFVISNRISDRSRLPSEVYNMPTHNELSES